LLGARPDGFDVVDQVAGAERGRVASLLGLRHRRMAADAFAFLRGAAGLMAEDLARSASSTIEVTLCGDAHAANFGVFTSPEGRRVFDVTDFDEAATGPFEWDVKRLAVSLGLVAVGLGEGAASAEEVAFDVARAYRRAMVRFAAARRLDVWYAALDVDRAMADLRGAFGERRAESADEVLEEARGPSRRRAYGHLVETVDGRARFRRIDPLLTPLGDSPEPGVMSAEDLEQILDLYPASLGPDARALLAQFTRLDAAHLVRGVGSVGTQCFGVLYAGRDLEDLFILQVKEARASVVDEARSRTSSVEPGERVVTAQRLLQATPDELLGWHSRHVGGVAKSFYVRQYFDHRATVDLAVLSPRALRAYGRACAWTLARAHARSGRAEEIAGYLGSGEAASRAIARFSAAYVERALDDHRAFVDAIEKGRVTVGE
jgi:uncharacterized protein (DUF2252 family)